MGYIALMFLMHLDEFHAYKAFSNLIIKNDFMFTCYSFNDKKVLIFILEVMF